MLSILRNYLKCYISLFMRCYGNYDYLSEDSNCCVSHMLHWIWNREGFLRDIGIFLSYLSEDVLGFVYNKTCNHKCLLGWKVYGDEQIAVNIFEKYDDMCSKTYFRQWQQGKSTEHLTVAWCFYYKRNVVKPKYTARQILQCNYNDCAKLLYQEGKILDLLPPLQTRWWWFRFFAVVKGTLSRADTEVLFRTRR